MEESIHDTQKLPPNTRQDQKFYVGFYRNSNLEIIMDYIVNYPVVGTIWVIVPKFKVNQSIYTRQERILKYP